MGTFAEFRRRAGDESNTVLLLGSARSGTTWIGEMIDRHHDHRIVFEPCESCTFFVTTIEFRPTLQRQREDAATKGQVGRTKIFDGLLDHDAS